MFSYLEGWTMFQMITLFSVILPRLIQEWRGSTIHKWAELHNEYGPVVRIAPNQLSYITTSAWKDIYGTRGLPGGKGTPQMSKEELVFPGDDFEFFEAKPMISCDAANHARHRRVIGQAFSDRAIRDYGPILVEHAGPLNQQLTKHAKTQTSVNIVGWFNFTMFDITSTLVFGESFGCLRLSDYHPWVARVFPGMKLITWSLVIAYLPGLGALIQRLISKRIVDEANTHIQAVVDLAKKRMARTPERPDFMTHILAHSSHENGTVLSMEELYLDSQLLVVAGSETTATLLSGAVYYLSRNPSAMARLQNEIRSSFQSEAEITPGQLSKLPYLTAVINECLRLYPPGAINMPRRVPPGGAIIDGRHVPGGVEVGIAQFVAYRSGINFNQPLDFVPERWMGHQKFVSDKKEVFQPFSYGLRNCVGRNLAVLELCLILTRLLWKFDIDVLAGQNSWGQQKTYLSWAKPPLSVRLSPAHDNDP